jgi:hypothetical protein
LLSDLAGGREGRLLMARLRHEALTLLLGTGMVGAGCAPHDHEDPAKPPLDPPVLAGEYEAQGGGDVASIGFYGAEYQLRPSSCGADDEACMVHGTYRIDAALGTLVLRPDGSATDTVWPLRVEPRAGPAPASTPQSLHALAQIIQEDSDGTEVADYDVGSRVTTYTTPPLAVLMKAMGKCT